MGPRFLYSEIWKERMRMKLVITEKPSVAQSLAKVLGAKKRHEGYLEGNGSTAR